ncbi:MAG TPA: formyltransferase family protein, partial [Caulifigura sp.]|nr:formyltransferase family protein [Caulifigura sp.]
MRTVLICQEDAPLARVGMARWLGSCSDLAGMIVLRETGGRRWQRIKREASRIGWLRMLDVFAFRVYQKLFLASDDAKFCRAKLEELCAKYPPLRDGLPVLTASSPNSRECVEFLTSLKPDVIVASCKHILKPRVFEVAKTGAFALHPGICPEYRNAHGCFWALANDDVGNVGTTLLKIDAGIDTGPVYGYFRGAYDEVNETHLMIQRRMTLDHLDEIGARLREVHEGRAGRIETTGRASAEWGQPWLTKYLYW